MTPSGGRAGLFAAVLAAAAVASACSRRAGTEGAGAAPTAPTAPAAPAAPRPAATAKASPSPPAGALLRGRPPPEPSAGAPTWSGKVDQDWTQVGDFNYDWTSPAGKLRLEIVKTIVHEDAGEDEGLIVSALIAGKRTPVVVWPNVNYAKTWLLVKPVKKKGLLGIAIMSDWSDGQGDPAPDHAAEIRWDGNDVRVDEQSLAGWAK